MVKYLSVGVIGLGVTGYMLYNMFGTSTDELLSSYESDIDAGFSNISAAKISSQFSSEFNDTFSQVKDLLKDVAAPTPAAA